MGESSESIEIRLKIVENQITTENRLNFECFERYAHQNFENTPTAPNYCSSHSLLIKYTVFGILSVITLSTNSVPVQSID